MFKTRAALLGILTLLITSGIAASAASASGPYWRVAGSRLGQGVSKQVKLQAKGIIVFKDEVKGVGIKIITECRNSYSEGAAIEGQGNFQGQDKGRLTFEQCTVVSNANCPSVDQPIKTTQLKSYLGFNAHRQIKFVDVFEPQQGSRILTLKYPPPCPVAATPVEGAVAGEVTPLEQESQEGRLNFPSEPITTVVHEQQEKTIGLFFGTDPGALIGAYGTRLATNEPWGVFGS